MGPTCREMALRSAKLSDRSPLNHSNLQVMEGPEVWLVNRSAQATAGTTSVWR